jgi:raffinose/stachyose/melibiose transport system substrate-binding protein
MTVHDRATTRPNSEQLTDRQDCDAENTEEEDQNVQSHKTLFAALVAIVLLVAACSTETEATSTTSTQGVTATSAQTSEAPPEAVTLLVWSKEDNNANATALAVLDRRFEDSHPGVTVDRVNRGFEDYNAAVKLAVSGDNPPDVFQVSYGYIGMGPLVESGALLPLNDYAAEFGWFERIGANAAKTLSFSEDGLTWGGENLYGVGMAGEVVGVYYNKEKLAALGLSVPSSFDEFELALEAAKAAGEIPIEFGDADRFPGIHLWGPVSNTLSQASELWDWVTASPGATFDRPENVEAAMIIQDWASKGYFPDGFNGISFDDSLQSFSNGSGVFLVQGSWANTGLAEVMGDNLGFFRLEGDEGELTPVTSTFNAPFAISSKSSIQDLAAEYIDLITGDEAAELIAADGGLPAQPDAAVTTPEPGTSQADIYAVWKSARANDLQAPFIDMAGPLYDVETGGIQELLVGRITPAEFVKSVQQAYDEFHG